MKKALGWLAAINFIILIVVILADVWEFGDSMTNAKIIVTMLLLTFCTGIIYNAKPNDEL